MTCSTKEMRMETDRILLLTIVRDVGKEIEDEQHLVKRRINARIEMWVRAKISKSKRSLGAWSEAIHRLGVQGFTFSGVEYKSSLIHTLTSSLDSVMIKAVLFNLKGIHVCSKSMNKLIDFALGVPKPPKPRTYQDTAKYLAIEVNVDTPNHLKTPNLTNLQEYIEVDTRLRVPYTCNHETGSSKLWLHSPRRGRSILNRV